jgi:membrane-associated protein
VKDFIHMFLHVDDTLKAFAAENGLWVYGLLFLIIFLETGLVVAAALPGDSLLFTVGALAAQNILRPEVLLVLLIIAAIAGDSMNYQIGRRFGRGLFFRGWRLLPPSHLHKCEAFYAKHGRNAVVMARFLPVLRSIAPFVAGASLMPYRIFLRSSIFGSCIWVGLILGAGILFGQIPFVQRNFEVAVICAVGVIVSVTFTISWRQARAAGAEATLDQ